MNAIIQLLLGAIGGNGIGRLLKKANLGTLLNSITGAAGGLALGQAINSGADIGNGAVGSILGALAGGGAVTGIGGLLKNVLGKR